MVDADEHAVYALALSRAVKCNTILLISVFKHRNYGIACVLRLARADRVGELVLNDRIVKVDAFGAANAGLTIGPSPHHLDAPSSDGDVVRAADDFFKEAAEGDGKLEWLRR